MAIVTGVCVFDKADGTEQAGVMLALQPCIWKMPGSNLIAVFDYLD